MASEQIERILEQGEGVYDEAADTKPRMPFPTSYVLTREQEDELVDYAMQRLEDLEDELGREEVESPDWWRTIIGPESDAEGKRTAEKTFLGKRKLYDLTYRNDVEWRQTLLGGIFEESNLVVPIARRIVRQMTARAVSYFFGTDPWFAAYPVGDLDRDFANKTDRYARWKMDQAKLKPAMERGVERAFILGESVIKTTWKRRDAFHKSTEEVLVGPSGPILDANGDFILKSDRFVPLIVADDMGEMVDTGGFVLERDGVTAIPPDPQWQTMLVPRRVLHYNGPEAAVVNFLDFLCPLDAPSVQEADCVIHLYDLPVMDLAEQWKKEQAVGIGADEESTKKAIEMIRQIASEDSRFSSADKGYRPDVDNTQADAVRNGDPVSPIAEFHLRYDADGDGIMEEIMLVVDRRSRTPIFYDYEANITPDGKRPFEVMRINPVEGAWYGIGGMEMFDSSQKIIDLTVNRWNFNNSMAARVDFWSPHNTLQGRQDPNLLLNWGRTYTPAPGKTAKDCLESVFLNDNKNNDLREFFELFMQVAMNESGVQHANDSHMAGMESTKLATGIRNIEKAGQEMFSLYLGHLEPGVTGVLDRMVKLLFVNMDDEEVFLFFEANEEGGEGVGMLGRITQEELAGLEINVRMLMSRYRGEQILESSVRAVELVEKFYSLLPDVQIRVAPLFREMLKALQVSQVDKIIVPLPPMVAPGVPMDAAGIAAAAATQPRAAAPNL